MISLEQVDGHVQLFHVPVELQRDYLGPQFLKTVERPLGISVKIRFDCRIISISDFFSDRFCKQETLNKAAL